MSECDYPIISLMCLWGFQCFATAVAARGWLIDFRVSVCLRVFMG